MVRRLIEAGPVAAAVVPVLALVGWTIVLLMGAAVGDHPLWRVDPVNLSEAAALRDQATVVTRIRDGEDPETRQAIRGDLLFNDRVELTPLEAGIAAHRSEIVDIILFSSHTQPDAAAWTRLRCLAELEGDKDVNAVLDRYRPKPADLTCTGVTRPWK
jgi:hypothetical protein